MEKWKIKALGAARQYKSRGRIKEYMTIMSQLRKIEQAEKRPAPTPPKLNGRWIYRLWSASGELLYVGTTDPGRAREHGKTEPWWGEVHRATFEPVDTRAEQKCREMRAIREEHPKYR